MCNKFSLFLWPLFHWSCICDWSRELWLGPQSPNPYYWVNKLTKRDFFFAKKICSKMILHYSFVFLIALFQALGDKYLFCLFFYCLSYENKRKCDLFLQHLCWCWLFLLSYKPKLQNLLEFHRFVVYARFLFPENRYAILVLELMKKSDIFKLSKCIERE